MKLPWVIVPRQKWELNERVTVDLCKDNLKLRELIRALEAKGKAGQDHE